MVTAMTSFFLIQKRFADLQSEVHDLRLGLEALTKQVSASSSVPVTPRSLTVSDISPFTCDGKWCTADEDKHFLFRKGIVIGGNNTDCEYGDGILSVDLYNPRKKSGSNCPQGKGSVTFGVLNTASGDGAVVSGGLNNEAFQVLSSVSGGELNNATGYRSSISGGLGNIAAGVTSSVSGGESNKANGTSSSVSGGNSNIASGEGASVSGGESNKALDSDSSISGGQYNEASGSKASVYGGYKNKA